jgi:hypothetical protein
MRFKDKINVSKITKLSRSSQVDKLYYHSVADLNGFSLVRMATRNATFFIYACRGVCRSVAPFERHVPFGSNSKSVE